jgi:DNA polymerase
MLPTNGRRVYTVKMTAVEKTTLASFLALSKDLLLSGYKSAETEYSFADDDPEAAPRGVEQGDSLEKIAAEIRACDSCPLSKTRTNTAPGEGVPNPLVLVIGEGPGADEDAQGRPFVGKAGQLLDKMLEAINLSRNRNCFIANVVKCRPPNNRDPYPMETAACARFLERQISLLKPKFILTAGRIAAQTMLKTSEPIGKLRGKFAEYQSELGVIPILATYHPAALLRNEEYKRPAWEDLKLLRSRLENFSGAN